MYSSGIALEDSVRRKRDYAITAMIPFRFPQGATHIEDPHTVDSFLEAMAAAGVDVPRSAVAEVGGNSFSDMAKHVMSDRREHNDAQLVIVAHSTPDVLPSGVPSIEMLALQRPTAAAAFTLCDEGPSIAYTAIEIARQFAARYEYDRVLILLAENSTFPYVPHVTAAEAVDADAAVLLLLVYGTPAVTTIERRVIASGAPVETMRAAVIDLILTLQADDPDGVAPVWFLGSQLHEFETDVEAVTGAEVRLSAAGQPVTGVWSDASNHFASTGSLSSVLVDYDAVAGALVACRLTSPDDRPASVSSTDDLRTIARTQGLQAGIDSIAGAGDFRDLLALRLGFSEFLLARVIAHLRSRSTGESTILMQQLVKAQLADVVIAHLEIDAQLSVILPSTEAVAQLDRRITDTDRAILRLFGGWGYLRGEESVAADLSERLLGTASPYAEGARHG